MKRLLTVFACLITVPLFAAVDLSLTGALSVPTSAEVGKEYKLTFNLLNGGDQAIDGAKLVVKVPVPAGGAFLGCSASAGSIAADLQYALCRGVSGTSLAGGASLPITVRMKAPAAQGSFTANLQADPDAQLAESNEANNTVNISTGFVTVVRAGVAATICPATATVGPIYTVQLALKNTGSADIRYPGITVEVNGGGTPVILASVDPRGGSVIPLPIGSASTVGTPQLIHKFVVTPSAADTPLRAGTAVPVNISLKSTAPQTVKVTGSIDTQAIQDTTSPKDNTVTCTITVQ